MRIGLITGEYPPMRGGIATQTQFLARELAARGHTVHVLTDVRGHEAVGGVHLHPTVEQWGVLTARQTVDWAGEHHLDLVNLHYQTAAFDMSPMIHFLPNLYRDTVPFVTTFHDLRFPYLFPKAGPVRSWIVDHTARASSGVVATNAEDASHLRALNPNLAMIPIGSNLSEGAWAEKYAADLFGKAGFVLAFFGFVNHSKGLGILLESIANLHREQIPARLLMIGDRTGSSDATNAAHATHIDQQIANLGLTDSVRWTGYAADDDVRAYLRTADAVVMPFRDGASYRRSSMTSALSVGCALVTTTPAVAVPDFRHGENMMLVPPNDAPALTNTLRTLYNSPALAEKLRAGARQLSNHFSWAGITRSYLDFYRSLIESSA